MKIKTVKIAIATLMIILKSMLFIYPVVIISFLIFDTELKKSGESQLVPMWFETTTDKYNSWAEYYLESEYALSIKSYNVPATEWPMFGSVFFLLTTKELQAQGKIDVAKPNIHLAINNAIKIITSHQTATWVKKKWRRRYLLTGITYLEKENLFYRMLLIMGISSYQTITNDTKYHSLLSKQTKSLYSELKDAKYHLLDDYPNQCYPPDVLWAVSAIKDSNTLLKEPIDINPFIDSFIKVFNSKISSKTTHLPAFQTDATTGRIIQEARGRGTSGILQFASNLDKKSAKMWYNSYEKYFWKETNWMVGFKEFAGKERQFMDADTGVIIDEYASVAMLFGIGASKSVGRLDHTLPLTIEMVALSWPTPFGFLVPSIMGKLAVDSWALGDVALLFSMTRPIDTDTITHFDKSIPWSIWLILFIFTTIGVSLIWLEIRWIRRVLGEG